MIAVYRSSALAAVVDACLPPEAVVHDEWPSFQRVVGRSLVALVAFERPGEPCSEAALRELAERGHPPLVLVTRPDAVALDVVAHLRCHTCIDLATLAERITEVVEPLLAESPRHAAARALEARARPGPITEKIIAATLVADPPVGSVAALVKRLRVPSWTLRRHWRREVGKQTGVTLHEAIRLGRAAWEVANLGDRTIDGVSLQLRIGNATVARDFELLTGRSFSELDDVDEAVVRRALLDAFRLSSDVVWARRLAPRSGPE